MRPASPLSKAWRSMNDDRLPVETEIPWCSYQLKLRELANARAASEENLAADVIKVVISNLFILNAGGIAAIPTISTFLGQERFSNHDMVETFLLPGAVFIAGEILALLCAFIAYINHLFIAGFTRSSCEAEIEKFNTSLPRYQLRQNVVDIVFVQPNRNPRYYVIFIIISFWTAVLCGFFSLMSFIFGCYFLTGAVHALRGL